MEQLDARCRALAEKIYALDETIYQELGSSLGRTLIGSREKVLSVLERELSLRPQGQLILSDMALIGNMARTLPEGPARKQLLTEYNDIIVELKALEEEIAKGDISDINSWLAEHIHSLGQTYTTRETIIKATGEDVNTKYYLEYLRGKFTQM